MKYKFIITSCIALFVAVTLELRAQEEPEYKSITFFTLSWDGEISDLKYMSRPDGDVEAIRGTERYLNGPYRYTGLERLFFFEETENAEGTIIREPKGFYDIADTVDRVILLFISQSNSRYRIFPIDVNTENFSPGSYRFINLSQEPVAIQLGETVAEVAPQTDKTLMPEIGSSERFTAKIAYNDGDKWDLFFASEWTHRSNRRVLVMFFKDDDGKMQTRVTPL